MGNTKEVFIPTSSDPSESWEIRRRAKEEHETPNLLACSWQRITSFSNPRFTLLLRVQHLLGLFPSQPIQDVLVLEQTQGHLLPVTFFC